MKNKPPTTKDIKQALNKPATWYHSNNEDFCGKSLLTLSFIWLILGVVLLILVLMWRFSGNNELIANSMGVVFFYFMVMMFLLTVTFIYTYFYVYGRCLPRRIAILLFYILFILNILWLVPFLIVWCLVGIIVSYRAKTIDNFLLMLGIVFLDTVIVTIITASFSRLSEYLIDFFSNKRLNSTAMFWAVFIGACAIITVLVNEISLWRLYAKKVDDEKIRYNKQYVRHTIRKVKLAALIIFFFYATFSNDTFVISSRGDIINVITCVTLIILYVDKRKELGKI